MKNIESPFLKSIPKIDVQTQKLTEKLGIAKFIQFANNLECQFINGLNHFEVYNKTTNTKIIFRSIFFEQDKLELQNIIREMKACANLETLILDLPPILNENLDLETTSTKDPNNIYDFEYKLTGEKLNQYIKVIFSNVKQDDVQEGLIYQSFRDKKVEVDSDLSLLINYCNLKMNNKTLYLADFYFEEMLKNFIATSTVHSSRNLFQIFRLIKLFEAKRIASHGNDFGCSKCGPAKIKPRENLFYLLRDDNLNKTFRGDIFGSFCAEAFISRPNQTILAVTDHLFIEQVTRVFFNMLQQLKISNQKNFIFNRFGYLSRKTNIKFESSEETESQVEFIEKNSIFDAIFSVETEFTNEESKEMYTNVKSNFNEYKENVEIESFCVLEKDKLFFGNAKNQKECDLVSLIMEDIEQEESEQEKVEKERPVMPSIKVQKPSQTVDISPSKMKEIYPELNKKKNKSEPKIQEQNSTESQKKFQLKKNQNPKK